MISKARFNTLAVYFKLIKLTEIYLSITLTENPIQNKT